MPEFNPVPDTFKDGQHYIDIWEPLFFYETYNILINSRRGTDNSAPENAGIEAGSHFTLLEASYQTYEWTAKATLDPRRKYYGAPEDEIDSQQLTRFSLNQSKVHIRVFDEKLKTTKDILKDDESIFD